MAGAATDRYGRGLAAFLAAMALVLQVLLPNGFMVARTGDGATITICTGHGSLLVHPDDRGKPSKSPKQTGGCVCAFAGHGGGAPAIAPTIALGARVEPVSAPSSAVADLLPGRGLAAPPPPSQGPPDLSI